MDPEKTKFQLYFPYLICNPKKFLKFSHWPSTLPETNIAPENGWLEYSGQISIIPKPELRGFWGSSLIKPPFRVTSADVVII